MMAKPIGPLCNIRCEYCFYLSKEELFGGKSRSNYVMNDEVLEMYIRKYTEAQPPGTPEITFAWQGGEPMLLPQSFFEKAVEFEQKYARKGMRIQNAIQTNGTLITRSRAEWFAENNFLVGVSIDGPEDLHNKFRRDREGKGTFQDVMKGLENLKAAGAEFNTLTVVQSDNADHPRRVYDFLKSIGSEYLQFIPIVEPIGKRADGADSFVGEGAGGAAISGGKSILSGRSGGAGRNENGRKASSSASVLNRLASYRSVRPEQWGDFMNGVFDAWICSDIGRIYVQHFDLLLGLHAGYPSTLCVHAETCGFAMAIEHNGNVYSCDHYVFPEYYLGNVMEESLPEIVGSPLQAAFGQAKRDALPDVCRECRYLNLCRGACPKDRLIEAPGGKLNWLCEGYYKFYEHTEPHFKAMAAALASRMPASEYRRFFKIPDSARPGRNEPCPCGSGKKYKNCHGRMPSV